jgi:adenosylmethionine-8-amino-7-oxononanoate aminotransferase
MQNSPPWLKDGWPHIWLPYTQMQHAPLPQPVVDAQGCELVLADGTRLVDGISNWWSACHGHKHPHIQQKMQEQLARLPHVMFGGLANEQAYTLAKRLSDITPGNLSRALLLDSGSVAVEVALKMALQYWRNQGKEHKNRFLCFRNGYHGDTIGAMGVSDPEQNYHQAFKHALIPQYLVDIPTDEYSLAEFESLLEDHHRHIAGCIIEPLVQGAGGMKFHSPDMLAAIRNACAQYDILFIADEVAVGFGRTGYMFACEEAGITPDIMCLGKALTGSNITLAATMATETVFEGFLGDSIDSALMHGTTYMGTPLACSAAHASLDLFAREPRLDQVAKIEAQLLHELTPCRNFPYVVDVRVKGAIGAVQLDAERIDIPWFRNKFIELGVWLRPIEDIVYIAPPFVISEEQLTTLTRAVHHAVKEWARQQH